MSSDHPTDAATGEEALDPERARRSPEDAVDALEERTLGGPERRLDGGYPDDLSPEEQRDREDSGTQGADDEPEPAFDVDLDPAEQGDPAAAPRNPD